MELNEVPLFMTPPGDVPTSLAQTTPVVDPHNTYNNNLNNIHNPTNYDISTREKALHSAALLYAGRTCYSPNDVINAAKEFEKYIKGY